MLGYRVLQWNIALRGIYLIPTGLVADRVLKNYKATKPLNGVYENVPHAWAILDGLKLVGIIGYVVLGWDLIAIFLGIFLQLRPSWFGQRTPRPEPSSSQASWMSVRLRPSYTAPIGIFGFIDLVISTGLIAGICRQAEFLPNNLPSCHDATNWRNGTDNTNFFVVANATKAFSEDWSPNKICSFLVGFWAFAIAITILHLLLSLLNITHASLDGKSTTIKQHLTLSEKTVQVIFKPIGSIAALIMGIFHHLLPSIRFSIRYVIRSLRRVVRKSPVPPEEIEHWDARRHKKPEIVEVSVLPQAVVARIAERLHYADLVNLSRSSHALRARFFGYDGAEDVLDDLRQYACEGESKSSCSICRNQKCRTCAVANSTPQPKTRAHILKCSPCCSQCFYTQICQSPWASSRSGRHEPRCEASEGSEKGRNVYELDSLPNTMEICGICAAMTPAQLSKRMERGARFELERLARQPLSCQYCHKMLQPSRLRWWVCSYCQTECRSHLHA